MSTHVIRAPAGLGKTTMLIDEIATSHHKRVEFYVPTLKLAREIETQFQEKGVATQLILGREQAPDGGESMCKKAPLAKVVRGLGYAVFSVLCMGATVPGNKFTVKRCEYYQDCAYLKQFETTAHVLIYTHAYLPVPRNSFEKIPPDLVVIDESFLSTCLQAVPIPRDGLEDHARKDAAIGCVVNKMLAAIDDDKPLLEALRDAGVTPDALRELKAQLPGSGAHFLDFPTEKEALTFLDSVVPRFRLDLLLEILAAELETDRTESHGVTYDAATPKITLQYRRPIARFQYADHAPIIVIIDANADPELIAAWFSDITFEEYPVERNSYVVQCSTARGSTISFVPGKNKHPESRAWAERNLAGLKELITHEAEGGKKRVLVVGPQVLTGNPGKGILALLSCPPNGALEHFNGLRGVDKYKAFDTVIIIGRNQPGINELEDQARAIWYDSADALRFADDWSVETRPFRFSDPSKSMGVEVLVHPDPRIQRLHEQIREGESTQAIDRLRLIHAPVPKRVIIVSNIPLALEIDELVNLQALLYRTRLDRAWERLRGVLPLNPKWLAEAFPDLWPTPGAARTDLRAGGKSGQFPNSIYIRSLTTSGYSYRVAGQKRPSHTLSILPIPETMNELVRLHGLTVALRDPSGSNPGLEHLAAIAKAALPPLQGHGLGHAT